MDSKEAVKVQIRHHRGEISSESYWEVRVTGRGPVELYDAADRAHANEIAKEIRAEIRADRKRVQTT